MNVLWISGFLLAAPAPAPAPTTATAAAAAAAAAADVPLGDYVVKKGETCGQIARKLYGSSKYLPALHVHNPQLGPLPHKLEAGQILKVPRKGDAQKGPDATLTFLRNEVETYTPEQHPGRRDEPLGRGHKVSTLAASSAEVTFADEGQLRLGEQSLVVILGSTKEQAQKSGQAADTTLVTGNLKAYLGVLGGRRQKPMTLATPNAEVALVSDRTEHGETQVSVDAQSTTRVAVHRGKARVKAQRKTVVVPEEHGSMAEQGAPPTPPQPLPAEPVWKARPLPLVIQREVTLVGEYAAGTRADAPAPAQWRVQVAREDRFNDLVVDTTVPAAVTKLEIKLPQGGTYFARVSAIDGDGFEGRASEGLRFAATTLEMVPADASQPGQVVVTPGTFCSLDGGAYTAASGPIALRRGRLPRLLCAADATGARAVAIEVPWSIVGAPVVTTKVGGVRRDGGTVLADVDVWVRDEAGAAIGDAPLRASADPAVQLRPVDRTREPGHYKMTARWTATPEQLRVDLAVPGSDAVAVPLPMTPQPRLGVRGKVGVALLAVAVPMTAIGLGFTFADRGDPDKRPDLYPAGLGMLVLAPELLISGAVLVGLDQRDRRVRVAPSASPTSAGLRLIGRF